MLKHLRETKWAALAAMLLLAQPAFAQKYRPPAADEAAIEEAVNAAEAVAAELEAAAAAAPARPRTPRVQPEPNPAIWLLQDEDTKIYLFGTVHVLPPGFRWRSAAFDNVARRADELVMEVGDIDDVPDMEAMMRSTMLGKSVPVYWRVSPDRREALRTLIEASGMPEGMFDSLQSWAVWMGLIAFAALQEYSDETGEELTMDDVPGVETVLQAEFQRLGRPISGVETAAQQMSFLSSLSFADQRALLEALVDDYRRSEGEGQRESNGEDVDIDSWVAGNVDAIVIDREDLPGALYEVLLPRRNRAWTEWLITRLDRPGTVLFAVGAGHLAGPDSVQTMLAGRGFTVTRIH